MKKSIIMLVLLAVLLSVVAGASAQAVSRSYLIISNGNSLPGNLSSQIAAAGGTITNTISQVGIVVVSSSNPNFANSIRGVRAVVANARTQWLDPVSQVALTNEEAAAFVGNPPTSGDNDTRFDLQWGHDAVNAPEAWNAGQRGAGAVVAVLDTGFDTDHVDLASQIVSAVSFVPGEGVTYALADPFSHGTHTAGTVAAADNGFGTIGVAPDADLMLVKVLSDAGSGAFEWIIEGIVYATDNGADVISMSLGATLDRSGFWDDNGTPTNTADDVFVTAREVAELRNAISRATTYAYQSGVTVIASAGNDADDSDHNAAVIHVPSDSSHVISISATTTIGWGTLGSATPSWDGNFDHPASYTNFGRSSIEFGAPGGDTQLFGTPTGSANCTVGGLVRPCYVFDLVFSTGSNLNPALASYYWSGGTSMAAPHVSGVAAIIIGENGGEMSPAHVERELRQRARGQGNDPYLGAGAVETGY
jgi:lantibiotic leader peptide-processing serine protease